MRLRACHRPRREGRPPAPAAGGSRAHAKGATTRTPVSFAVCHTRPAKRLRGVYPQRSPLTPPRLLSLTFLSRGRTAHAAPNRAACSPTNLSIHFVSNSYLRHTSSPFEGIFLSTRKGGDVKNADAAELNSIRALSLTHPKFRSKAEVFNRFPSPTGGCGRRTSGHCGGSPGLPSVV